MLTAKEKLSAKPSAKLELATTIAALSLFAATFIGADIVPVQATNSASSSASCIERTAFECDRGIHGVSPRLQAGNKCSPCLV